MSLKKPDNVVYNNSLNKYDASIKEYPTNVGAPVIEVVDSIAWKNKNLFDANAMFKSKYDALKKEMQDFELSFQENKRIYSSKFNFEPSVGTVYHLYVNKYGREFLSILSPKECNFQYEGSYYLNHDKIWVRQ